MPLVQTLRFPAKCSPGAHRRLSDVFSMCAVLYNAALESWRGTFAWWREHHPGEPLPPELRSSKYDLMKEFTGVRSDLPEWERLAVQVGRCFYVFKIVFSGWLFMQGVAGVAGVFWLVPSVGGGFSRSR